MMSPATTESSPAGSKGLTRFAWLSIFAALLTIWLKTAAWWATDSVGLLSDAAESSVNLVGAVATLIALRIAFRPPNQQHPFGQGKAEYFSAALEGQMIFVAALFILYSATLRLIEPQPLQQLDQGLALGGAAAAVNAIVGVILLRVGRNRGSAALEADAKHLLTDVWTTAGVVVGLLLAQFTGLQWIDPLVAIGVALHILWIGWTLISQSASSLLDRAWKAEEQQQLAQLLAKFQTDSTRLHGLRTRISGRQQYAEVHVLVPGGWSVAQGHALVARIEAAVHDVFISASINCQLQPVEDPHSYDDFPCEHPLPENELSFPKNDETKRNNGVSG